MGYHRSTWDEQLASSALGLGLVIVVVVLVLAIWLTVKALELIARVFANHPRDPVLLTAIIVTGILVIAVIATSAHFSAIDLMAVISGGLLLLIAAVLDLADDQRVRRSLDRDTAVHAVLHEWWPAA